MPHDAKGNAISVGDTLVARFKVIEVYTGEEGCNVLVEAVRPHACPEAECAPSVTCNTRFFEKEEPAQAVEVAPGDVQGDGSADNPTAEDTAADAGTASPAADPQ